MSLENPQSGGANPEAVIVSIQQEAMVMGANDYEPSAFEAILGDLRAGRSTAEQAIRAARQIKDSKQNYH